MSKHRFNMWYKYGRWGSLERFGVAAAVGSFIMLLTQFKSIRLALRWPTDDFNELLKDPVYVADHEEFIRQKNNAAEMMRASIERKSSF